MKATENMLRNKHTGELKTITEVIHEAYTKHELTSLSKLNKDWEDYKPKEPLIKDGRACKIVRDWYEYHDTDLPIYCEDACTLSIDHGARIEFFQERVFRNLKQDYRYGITELCGDEE